MGGNLEVAEFKRTRDDPQPDVVAELERLLATAREGRIRTLGIVYTASGDLPADYEVSWKWVGEEGWRTAFLGGIAALQKTVLDSLCDRS